jgi:hypothetical protein
VPGTLLGYLPVNSRRQTSTTPTRPTFVSMLTGGATVEDLTQHLEHIRTVTIGLPANQSANIALTQKLIALWKEDSERA